MNKARFLFAATIVFLLGWSSLLAQQAEMSFFITSKGPGRGADLGGLAGADRHCQMLAEAAGAGSRSWRALSQYQPLPRGSPPSMPVIASARVPGTMPRVFVLPRMWLICTERATISTSRPD